MFELQPIKIQNHTTRRQLTSHWEWNGTTNLFEEKMYEMHLKRNRHLKLKKKKKVFSQSFMHLKICLFAAEFASQKGLRSLKFREIDRFDLQVPKSLKIFLLLTNETFE